MTDNTKKADRKPVSTAVVCLFALTFIITLYAPLEIYSGNVDEFLFDFFDIIKIMAPLFVVLMILGAVIVFAVCAFDKNGIVLCCCIIPLFTAVFLALMIQGTFLSKSLGIIDGSKADWSLFGKDSIISAVLWIGLIVCSIVISAKQTDKFLSMSKLIGIFGIAFMVFTMVINCLTTDCLKKKENIAITYDNILNLSKEENLIVVVLDTADASKVTELLNNNSSYAELLQDFTFYPDTMGSYTWTSYSIPFMLSGEWYEGNESIVSYKERSFVNGETVSFLRNLGYDIGIYTTELPQSSEFGNEFVNVTKSDSDNFKSPFGFIKMQIKLVGLKYFPYALKQYCEVTNEYIYNYSLKETSNSNIFKWENTEFMKAVDTTKLEYNDKKSFRFIHIMGPHYPYEANEEINGLGEGEADYMTSLEASFSVVGRFLDKLREKGVYNNSSIVLLGDHGYEDEVIFRQNPMLMVKGRNEDHKLEISNKQASYEDITDVFKRLTDGEKGSEVFNEVDYSINGRKFLAGSRTFTEYVQIGEAWNKSTMVSTGITYPADTD